MMRRPTRRQRAAELLERLQRGPEFPPNMGKTFTAGAAKYAYRLWVESWVIPDVRDLIPELREKKP